MAVEHPKVVEDLVPKLLPLAAVQRVLQNLLRERVSIRDAVSILEALGEAAAATRNPVLLTEYVRQADPPHGGQALSESLGRAARHGSSIPAIERTVEAAVEHGEQNSHVALAPQAIRDILNRITARIGTPDAPVVAIASSGARYFLRQIAEPVMPNLFFTGAQRSPARVARAVPGQHPVTPGAATLQKTAIPDDLSLVRHTGAGENQCGSNPIFREPWKMPWPPPVRSWETTPCWSTAARLLSNRAIWAITKSSSPPICRPTRAARPPSFLPLPIPPANGWRPTLAGLKKELEGMRRALAHTAFAPAPWMGNSPNLPEAYAALTAAEVDPDLARDIVQGAESRHAGSQAGHAGPGGGFRHALAEELESRITVEPMLGRGEAKPRIVALVGPPGSGKTTTLVKLAVNYGLAARRPVVLVSMDTYRVAAAEQLRSYAAILGVGFQVLETVTALAQAIEENRGKELIFIDTPGLGAGKLEHSPGLARFLSSRTDIDTQLVLSSSTKSADLTRMVDAFEIFRPQRLLFTKLDETGSFGPMLNESARTAKPLSFFTGGQRIPEDLEIASRSRLAELILTARTVEARSAA